MRLVCERKKPARGGAKWRTTCRAHLFIIHRWQTTMLSADIPLSLPLSIIGGWIVDELSVLCETETVAGAIPRMLCTVVFQLTAEVRTAGNGGSQKPDCRLSKIDRQLWMQYRSGGENSFAKRLSLPCTKSARSIAATIDEVIPHLLKPVATKREMDAPVSRSKIARVYVPNTAAPRVSNL